MADAGPYQSAICNRSLDGGGVFVKVLSDRKGTKRRLWVMVEILMATKLEPLEEGGSLASSLVRFVWRRQTSEGLKGLVVYALRLEDVGRDKLR